MRHEVAILEDIKKIGGVVLGCVFCGVKIASNNPSLKKELNSAAGSVLNSFEGISVSEIPRIKSTRLFYKTIGKDPSRYRGSAEALLRRIVSKKALYYINNVVDINNLISIKHQFCVGSYDLEKITSPIQFAVGRAGESYKGIGKEGINLEDLPVFADSKGPFGSPTSDSERAMIKNDTKSILMMIISFSGRDGVETAMRDAGDYLKKYAGAEDIRCQLVE